MIKRILLTFMALLAIYTSAAACYRIYDPRNSSQNETASSMISYNALRDLILSRGSGSVSYLFFCSLSDDNCVYVKNTVMHAVEKETGADLENIIYTVDITPLEENLNSRRITAEWGIHSWPAFLCVSTDGQNITVASQLEWDSSSPMTASDIENWLEQSGLILDVLR